MQCSDRVSSQGLENLYLSKVSPEMLQQVTEDISSDSKVLYFVYVFNAFYISTNSVYQNHNSQLITGYCSISTNIIEYILHLIPVFIKKKILN